MNSTRLSGIVTSLLLIFVIASCIYGAVTGEAVGIENLHYNTLGRILSALGAVFFTGFAVWSWKENRRLDDLLDQRRKERDA
jgi:p-aminobenzoyl-glutamate transporter AbgT